MRFFAGGYSENSPGIALIDPQNGMKPMPSEVENPSWLLPNRDRSVLYAVSETHPDGGAAAFRFENDALTLVSRQKCGGGSPCHLALSRDERFLYAANYSTGSVSVFPVNGAEILPRVQLVEHGEGAHAHCTVFHPADDAAYVCDLGLDRVFLYRQDPETGLLTREDELEVPKGAGPRHLIFDGNDRMYVACELGSLLVFFEREAGKWIRRQILSTLPEGFEGRSSVAAIRLDGKTVCVSNRGHDSVAVFALNEDGTCVSPSFRMTGASFPRDFRLFDGKLYAANQFGGCVTVDGKAKYAMPGVSCITEVL